MGKEKLTAAEMKYISAGETIEGREARKQQVRLVRFLSPPSIIAEDEEDEAEEE